MRERQAAAREAVCIDREQQRLWMTNRSMRIEHVVEHILRTAQQTGRDQT